MRYHDRVAKHRRGHIAPVLDHHLVHGRALRRRRSDSVRDDQDLGGSTQRTFARRQVVRPLAIRGGALAVDQDGKAPDIFVEDRRIRRHDRGSYGQTIAALAGKIA